MGVNPGGNQRPSTVGRPSGRRTRGVWVRGGRLFYAISLAVNGVITPPRGAFRRGTRLSARVRSPTPPNRPRSRERRRGGSGGQSGRVGRPTEGRRWGGASRPGER